MGYDREELLKRFNRWKNNYQKHGGVDPCLHRMFEEENLLQIIQHDNKIYAGTLSQQRRHQQTTENTVMIIGEIHG